MASRPTLYVLPASHPCAAVEAALALKGIDYERVELLPIMPVLLGPLRWGGTTVPGMRLDGERLVGSRPIMHRLERVLAEPPLLPAAQDRARERVLEAERWGDEVFQSVPRRLIDAAFLRRPGAMETYASEARLPIQPALMRPALPLTARLMAIKNKATDEAARADIAALPDHLRRIEGWIAEGLLGGESPNAADLQIGSTVRLLMTIGDVAPLVQASAAAALTRYFPRMVGAVPAGTLPAQWLAAQSPA